MVEDKAKKSDDKEMGVYSGKCFLMAGGQRNTELGAVQATGRGGGENSKYKK